MVCLGSFSNSIPTNLKTLNPINNQFQNKEKEFLLWVMRTQKGMFGGCSEKLPTNPITNFDQSYLQTEKKSRI